MSAATPVDVKKLRHVFWLSEQRYLRSLPPEHFMEATTQGTQRAITLASFALVSAARPDVQVFNELLVQYPRGDDEMRPGQVVPDNMVVVHPEPIIADGSFNTPLQPVGPFLMLEYVSKGSVRKDYDDNMAKYQDELRVPYYLLFYPDADDLSLFRHTGERFDSVRPNAAGRLAIPELELEAALLDGWVRFWFRGELLPLPGELKRALDAEKAARAKAEKRATTAEKRATTAEKQVATERTARTAAEQRTAELAAELAKLREQLKGPP